MICAFAYSSSRPIGLSHLLGAAEIDGDAHIYTVHLFFRGVDIFCQRTTFSPGGSTVQFRWVTSDILEASLNLKSRPVPCASHDIAYIEQV